MAKTKLIEFSQKVFTKKFQGVEERGIILRQKFYPLLGVSVGEEIKLRETNPHDTEYFCVHKQWSKLPSGRNI